MRRLTTDRHHDACRRSEKASDLRFRAQHMSVEPALFAARIGPDKARGAAGQLRRANLRLQRRAMNLGADISLAKF